MRKVTLDLHNKSGKQVHTTVRKRDAQKKHSFKISRWKTRPFVSRVKNSDWSLVTFSVKSFGGFSIARTKTNTPRLMWFGKGRPHGRRIQHGAHARYRVEGVRVTTWRLFSPFNIRLEIKARPPQKKSLRSSHEEGNRVRQTKGRLSERWGEKSERPTEQLAFLFFSQDSSRPSCREE